MTRAPIALAAIFMAGCYDAPRPECGFRCGPSAACPADYTCASDNHCHENGSSPDLACGPPVTPPPDLYSPRVVFTNPAPDATVDPSTPIQVGFDVDVAGVSRKTFEVTDTATNAPVVATVVYTPSTHQATFSPSIGLPPNRDLLVQLSEEIFDPETNRALLPTSYTIHTGPDTTPPTITSTTPVDGATGVSVGMGVAFLFSEIVGHVDTTSVNLLDGATQVVGSVTLIDDVMDGVFFPHDQLLPNRTYTLRVPNAPPGSVVTDLAGNPLAATFTMTFTTGADTVGPRLRGLMPQDFATHVPVTSNVVVTFDEPLMGVDTTSFQLDGGAIAGTVTMSNNNKTATFDPAANLPAASVITVSLSAGITDVFGNAVTAIESEFTTM
jgi:hypothetical protein